MHEHLRKYGFCQKGGAEMPSPKERIQEIDVMLSHGMILEWKKRRELVREKRR